MAIWDFLKRSPARDADQGLEVWMDPSEFSQVYAIIRSLRATRILEWGSGGSTRTLLNRCPFIESYTSIEHVPEWYEKVKREVSDPRLSLHLVEPDSPLPAGVPWEEENAWRVRAESDGSIMQRYVAKPAELGVEADFVLVDGRARTFCLKAGWELLRPGGVLVLHDAQREEYHATVKSFPDYHFFEPWTQGQVALMRKPD